jgi:membrane associated rhomboid family serine protease
MSLLPPVVKNLLIINGILFLATYLALKSQYHLDLNEILGLHYPTSPKFHAYQFITYMFMHANLEHIFFNMFGLWTFGYVLENYWGPKRFLIYYVVTALGAAAIQTGFTAYEMHSFEAFMLQPDPETFRTLYGHYTNSVQVTDMYNAWKEHMQDPAFLVNARTAVMELSDHVRDGVIVGASGALFGILLAFGMLFPNRELLMLFFPVPIKAKYFVILYGGVELFSGLSRIQGDNIAHFAHLGGMLFGFILIKIWQKDRTQFY